MSFTALKAVVLRVKKWDPDFYCWTIRIVRTMAIDYWADQPRPALRSYALRIMKFAYSFTKARPRVVRYHNA